MHMPIFSLEFSGTAVITEEGRQITYEELKRLTDEWAAPIPSRSLVFHMWHVSIMVSFR